MPLYRVLLRGENFLLNLTGEPELLGFHVTHYVRAATEEEAKRIATILVRKNQHINSGLLNTPENPTRLECESIKRAWWRRSANDGRYTFWNVELEEADDEPAPPEPSADER